MLSIIHCLADPCDVHNLAILVTGLVLFGRKIALELRPNLVTSEFSVSANELIIDHSEVFPELGKAPIVEAVLHWHAMASKQYAQGVLLKDLRSAFPNYEATDQHNLEAGFTGAPGSIEFKHRSAWQGIRLTEKGTDGKPKFVCQFLGQGVVFSRLAPYEGWGEFEPEALRFWKKHCELGNPSEVARLSVRFISQIAVDSVHEIEQYIDTVCEPLNQLGLSANSYYHQDTIELANEPYVINTVHAVQSTPDGKSNLIVDITVSTSESIELGQVEEKLKDLRFIKNKVFFTLIKDDAPQIFGET